MKRCVKADVIQCKGGNEKMQINKSATIILEIVLEAGNTIQ